MKGIDVIVEQAGSRYQIAVVRVLGQIDTTTSHELERRLQYLLKDRQFEIVIDLSKVTYISSAGWGIFISEIRGIRESGGDLKLVGMTPEVAEVFELLEFHNILESFKTVEAAVERFEKPKAPPAPEKHKLGESIKDSEPVGKGDVRRGSAADMLGDVRQVSEPAVEGHGIRSSKSVAEGHGIRGDRSGVGQASISETGEHGSARQGIAGPTAGTGSIGETGRNSGETGRESGETESSNAWISKTQPVSKDLELMILEIVREHPDYGCLKIRKELLEHDYRRPINPLALFMELKRLNLETKEKRKRYADSSAVVGSKK
jgi:anti-sigma B factor antagonist